MPERRHAIIKAATRLFAEHGYADVRMVDIGTACDLSAGALYLFFDNKLALLDALCTDFMAQIEDHLRRQLESVDDADDRFERRMRAHAGFVVRHRDQLRVLRRDFEYLQPDDRSRIWTIISRLMSNWIDDLQVLRPELNREQARIAAYAGVAVLQSIATSPPALAPDALTDLLAASASAAQRATWPLDSADSGPR